ncbi:MAG: iron-sulfur cluster assembly scaffold protein [Verrucomicrobiota bacterium]|nr:iron-sulfur cluster assembly scaffold protein [Verrucomicrobiota bacterium]
MKEDPLHREILEEHARNPKFYNQLATPTHEGKFQSSKTGNTCSIQLRVENNQIKELAITIQGSALATAVASILSCEIAGLTPSNAENIRQQLINLLEEDKIVDLPGELCVYESLKRFPERHDCALLAWRAMGVALTS